MTTLKLCVAHVDALTAGIRRLLLRHPDGLQLPAFSAGAHIMLHIPAPNGARAMRRAYSLVNAQDADTHPPAFYEIAVQLEEAGTGGSRWVHQLTKNTIIDADPPKNDFSLVAGTSDTVLIAGGIGITPILAMARTLASAKQTCRLHYIGREAARMAYYDDVLALPGAHCWTDGGDPEKHVPLHSIIGTPAAGRHLYVCGPKGLIGAVLAAAHALGWENDRLHCELFSGTLESTGDTAFDVTLRGSGITLHVPHHKSILDVMLDAGLDPLFDCRRGDCGVCVTTVIEGDVDHRDICLSANDRARGNFCPCVSRTHSGHLVLDL